MAEGDQFVVGDKFEAKKWEDLRFFYPSLADNDLKSMWTFNKSWLHDNLVIKSIDLHKRTITIGAKKPQ